MFSPTSTKNNNKFSAPRPDGQEITTIVITYSVCEGNIHKTISTMHDRGTSIHYTIGQDGFQNQYHLETSMAFYAGKSSWNGVSGVNAYGIGVMLINDANSEFPEVQIDKLIELIQDINVRYETTMEVLGLGEVAVDRHIAPGKLFPWHKLAEAVIGKAITIPAEILITLKNECRLNVGDQGDKVTALQEDLKKHGYGIEITGIYDNLTSKAVNVFYGRYLQDQADINCWNERAEYVLTALLGEDWQLVTANEVESSQGDMGGEASSSRVLEEL